MLEFEPGEEVVVQARPHWFIFLTESLIVFVLAAVPVLAIFLPGILAPLGVSIDLGAPALFLTATWWLLLWIVFFTIWTNYHLDSWIVTNRRVIDIEQHGLFSRQVSECRLDRVQDITAEERGFLATFLHFGNVYIQTAGESSRFVMRDIPNPYGMKDLIFRHHPRMAPPVARDPGETGTPGGGNSRNKNLH